jgi:hypothetical protein
MSGHHEKSRVLLYGNISTGNTTGCGLALQENLTSIAIGNTVHNALYAVQQCSSENIILNNIFSNCEIGLLMASDFGNPPKECDHNIWHNLMRLALEEKGKPGCITLEDWRKRHKGKYDMHSLEADPLFADAGAGDFRLQSGSPAIDGGQDLGADFRMGLDPESRFPGEVILLDQNGFGDGWEIGAFVYPE